MKPPEFSQGTAENIPIPAKEIVETNEAQQVPHLRLVEKELESKSILVERTVQNIISEISIYIKKNAFYNRSLPEIIEDKINHAVCENSALEENVSAIKMGIRKELAYLVHKEKFEALKENFLREGVLSASPNIISKTDGALKSVIKRNMRLEDNEIDWDFVGEKIGINIIYKRKIHKRESISWSLEVCREKLADLLLKENPKEFNVRWIGVRDDFLYRKTLALIREQGMEWKDFFCHLARRSWRSLC